MSLTTLLDNLQDIILNFDTKAIPELLFANSALFDQMFISKSLRRENKGMIFDLVHPEDRAAFRGNLIPTVPRKQFVRLVRNDGLVIPYEAQFTDLISKDGSLVNTQVVLRKTGQFETVPRKPTEKVVMDKTLARYIDQIATIADIGRDLGQDLDLKDIYKNLGESVQRMFPDASVFFVSRYLPDQQKIKLVYGKVDDEALNVDEIPLAELDHSPQGTQTKVIMTGKPLIISDLVAHRGGTQNMGMIVGEDDLSGMPLSSILVPMIAKNEVLGVVQLQSNQLDRFSEDDSKVLAVVANVTASHIQNSAIHEKLREAYAKTMEALGYAIELRDGETNGHSQRVTEIATKLATALGVSDSEMINIHYGALLHDIGKIGVPDAILLKPGQLTPEEKNEMKKHTVYGYEILKQIEFLKYALDIPLYHHERWDGTGYPYGLAGEDIPFFARIFAFADVYDALGSDRVYRKAWPKRQIIDHIRAGIGKHFDPEISKIFIEMIEEPSYAKSSGS